MSNSSAANNIATSILQTVVNTDSFNTAIFSKITYPNGINAGTLVGLVGAFPLQPALNNAPVSVLGPGTSDNISGALTYNLYSTLATSMSAGIPAAISGNL